MTVRVSRIAFCALLVLTCALAQAQQTALRARAGSLVFRITPASSRYEFRSAETTPFTAAPVGITISGKPVSLVKTFRCHASECGGGIEVEGKPAGQMAIKLTLHHAELTVSPSVSGVEVVFVSGGAAPAYGLADHGILRKPYDTDQTGFADNHYLSGESITRLESNLLIYPKHGFASVLIDPRLKIIATSTEEIRQGVVHADGKVQLHYFFGTPHDIYREFLLARRAAGFPVFAPKLQMFSVGWEAFGALGWVTNQDTVEQSLKRYLAEGYPLRWAVIGSGFWPAEKRFHETTSFGLIDHEKYPDMRATIARLHDLGLKVLFGLRISFITDGPYADEGIRGGYFLQENGKAKVYIGDWPKSPYYLLDAHNPAALDWYIQLTKKWTDLGVDGFKEDYYDFGRYGLRDDKIDPVNNRLMHMGIYLIERNGYLSSNGELHRINDFNFDQNQDRGPVNALSLAYAGLPLTYPDIVGGTFGESRFNTAPTPRMEQYMMRNVRWASLHSSMAMGQPPWHFPSKQTREVMLASAQFHERIAPYLYSQGRRFAVDGFPWTMAPLPVAFPQDQNVYGRDNASVRGYEWMIGDSILATPLYGDDYEKASARDVYLPDGNWMDYDTGKLYSGKQTLKGFPIPVTKTPVFIGGSGIVLERIGGVDTICAYPVARKAVAKLWIGSASRPITVTVDVTDWNRVRVFDATTGKLVPTKTADFARQWQPTPSHDYRLQ